MNRTVNIRLDEKLWHDFKVEAVKQNKSLQNFLTEAIKEKLAKIKS